MNSSQPFHLARDLPNIAATLSDFDGACDPEFDSDFEELERHCIELRLTLDHN